MKARVQGEIQMSFEFTNATNKRDAKFSAKTRKKCTAIAIWNNFQIITTFYGDSMQSWWIDGQIIRS